MKKQTGSFPFVSLFDRTATGVPMHRQIYEKMRQAILKGEIPAKSRIPSSRSLAAQLGVSRMTIVNAYDQLYAEGYLESKIGAGTFVAGELPEELLQTPKRRTAQKAVFSRELNLSKQGRRMERSSGELVREHSANTFLPFQNGLTAIDSFPFNTWARIAARLSRHAPRQTLVNGDLAGYYPPARRDCRSLKIRPRLILRTRTSHHHRRSAAGSCANHLGFPGARRRGLDRRPGLCERTKFVCAFKNTTDSRSGR